MQVVFRWIKKRKKEKENLRVYYRPLVRYKLIFLVVSGFVWKKQTGGTRGKQRDTRTNRGSSGESRDPAIGFEGFERKKKERHVGVDTKVFLICTSSKSRGGDQKKIPKPREQILKSCVLLRITIIVQGTKKKNTSRACILCVYRISYWIVFYDLIVDDSRSIYFYIERLLYIAKRSKSLKGKSCS